MDSHDIAQHMVLLIFQIVIILAAAKLAAEICGRILRIPAVLGELTAGALIGPFLLGGIAIKGIGPIFPLESGSTGFLGAIPIEIYLLGQIAAVILLFTAGIETDLKQFLRRIGPATLVAAGGVIFPFVFGVMFTVLMGYADGFTDPTALFIGAVLTATSVGITARVLTDIHELNSPEGVTIIAAAVVDDVLGILVLTIVVAMAGTTNFAYSELGFVAIKAIGFWLLLTGGTIWGANWISKTLLGFRIEGTTIVLALGLALAAAALAESFGLAMIIGAYSVGLGLSGTEMAKKIEPQLMGVFHFLVPIFFVVMGMLTDFSAMREGIVFGLVITAVAIIVKVFGAGLPSLAGGYNLIGAWRIGLGMLPRGEVALIIAGIGLSKGLITQELFGVVILMTVVTTVLASVLLPSSFRNGRPGLRITRKANES